MTRDAHPQSSDSLLARFPLAHLAIAVESLAAAAPLYRALGFSLKEPEEIPREKVRVQAAVKGELTIELMEAHPPGAGPVAKFLARRGPGLHHVALRSADLDADLAMLAASGVKPLKDYPASGAQGTRVAFLDPKSTGGVLVELVSLSCTT